MPGDSFASSIAFAKTFGPTFRLLMRLAQFYVLWARARPSVGTRRTKQGYAPHLAKAADRLTSITILFFANARGQKRQNEKTIAGREQSSKPIFFDVDTELL